ncbi:MAG: sulfotransferase [Cyanobacteria bacterium P01_A01_bin.123]
MTKFPYSLKNPLGDLSTPLESLKTAYRRWSSTVHPKPIIILGNPKAGTTVIASLLGKATNQAVTIDPFYRIDSSIKIREDMQIGSLSFKEVINQNKHHFSTAIIKDPYFIFMINSVIENFSESQFVFIARDPRDNIRSILNRLDIPGNLDQLDNDQLKSLPERTAWRLLLEGELPKVDGDNYIEKLAYRWTTSIDLYETQKERIQLIRYEDFMADKVAFIRWLATQLCLEYSTDIEEYVDNQFQPIGNRNISWIDFFGAKNLDRINHICRSKMLSLGYQE